MGSWKLTAAALLLLTALLGVHLHVPVVAAAGNSDLFRDYIGANFNGVGFTDVPVDPRVRFDYILAFAIDYTTETEPPSPTDGRFNIFWEKSVLTPSAVAEAKRSNPNARVAVSLGGATVNNAPVFFNITSVDCWVSNAVDSLTGIIQQYGLDGIDIDYERFQVDPATFAECVGRLVAALKGSGVIRFASIAPYGKFDVQRYYMALWAAHGADIDYVNFQFYAYGANITAAEYVSHFDEQVANYPGASILASFSTSPPAATAPTALSACRTLKSQGKLYGVFIWAADNSKNQGFKYETEAQALLASYY